MSKQGKTGGYWATLLAAIFGALGIIAYVISGTLTSLEPSSYDFINYLSQTGNAILSLAGLLLVYAAFMTQQVELRLQRKELKLNRKEMKLTRLELEGQRKQFELQTSNLISQGMENTLFKLLEAHNDNRRNWEEFEVKRAKNGMERDRLNPGLHKIRNLWDDIYNSRFADGKRGSEDSEEAVYKFEFDASDRNWLVHENSQMFSNIENCLNFIDSSQGQDHDTYYRLVFNRLISSELMLTRAYWIYTGNTFCLDLLNQYSDVDSIISQGYPGVTQFPTFTHSTAE